MALFKIGDRLDETVEVSDGNATIFLGPDGPRVLSTPNMIGIMERACRNLILPMLGAGHDTVGVHVNVYHRAAAPMGSTVQVQVELTSVNNRRADFTVHVAMGDKVIGEGTHQRAIVDVKEFRARVDSR